MDPELCGSDMLTSIVRRLDLCRQVHVLDLATGGSPAVPPLVMPGSAMDGVFWALKVSGGGGGGGASAPSFSSSPLLVTASGDQVVRLWDLR